MYRPGGAQAPCKAPARRLRGADKLAYTLGVQMIFQDPQASLNPRQRLRQILGESLKVHKLAPSAEIPARIDQALTEVGLDTEYRDRFPHQISGGQRQRIGIARALALKPSVIVCDEAVAALDVSIQAQVLDLLRELRRELALTYLFIGHDLAVIESLCDRIAVMEQGRIVDVFDRDALRESGRHPATRRLLDAVLPVSVGARLGRRTAISVSDQRAAA